MKMMMRFYDPELFSDSDFCHLKDEINKKEITVYSTNTCLKSSEENIAARWDFN